MKIEEYISQRIGVGWAGAIFGALIGAVITNKFDIYTFAVLGMCGGFFGTFVGILGWFIIGRYEVR